MAGFIESDFLATAYNLKLFMRRHLRLYADYLPIFNGTASYASVFCYWE